MNDDPQVSATQLHVGSYKRRMKVSLDRMYENALDWEHLPFLHGGSFSHIELLEVGDTHWRARVGVGPKTSETIDPAKDIVLELRLDRDHRRWISSTLEGPGQGSQIWTHVFQFGERDIEIQADFFVPGVSEESRQSVGSYYAALYKQLYDEDEAMMLERQVQLDAGKDRSDRPCEDEIDLGHVDDIRGALPLTFSFKGRSFRLVEDEGDLIAHASQCPHILGPLGQTRVIDGAVTCPWHAYTFDIRTGKCRTGQSCKLARAPDIILKETTGHVVAR
jgi:nitrite reductase/ring-hydroxylating ferredoxin subunit